jgi:hypothetical protein
LANAACSISALPRFSDSRRTSPGVRKVSKRDFTRTLGPREAKTTLRCSGQVPWLF